MHRFALPLLALLLALGVVSAAGAQVQYEFKLGFKLLADQIPDVVGEPLEDEHWGANGDSLQMTTKGLMAWRKADNWTAFTNGSRTWVNGPLGVQSRPNDQRFEWENDGFGQVPALLPPPPPGSTTPVPAPPDLPARPGLEYRYYDVSAQSYMDAVASAGEIGPTDPQGVHWPAQFNFTLRYQPIGVPGPDGSYEYGRVYGSPLIIVLPRWNAPAGTSPLELAGWYDWLRKLAAHEVGHADILYAWIPDAEAAMRATTAANRATVWKSLLTDHLQRQMDYDVRTEHGMKQEYQ